MEKISEKSIDESSDKQDKENKQNRLLCFEEIPPWQKDNDCLLSGYRPITGSLSECLKSMFKWHNETVNIHSHSIGSVIFALLPIHFYFYYYRHVEYAQPIDALVFLVYFAGVSACFACSTAFHTIGNHSQPVASMGNRIDCSGIVLLMWSASLASIHFAFVCDLRVRAFHWFLTSACASGCISFILGPVFTKPSYRTTRALTYASLGFSGLIFMFHGMYLYGYDLQRRRLSVEYMGLMAALNMTGALLYTFRFPEAWFPYRFDFMGASHQIMHVAVLLAGLVHYKGLANAFIEVRSLQHTC